MINIGDKAPDFALPDSQGITVRLSDFVGKRVIVYFYPAAMTPGCTIEAVDFSRAKDDFGQAGISVLGISPDNTAKLAKFISRDDLSVTLLADPDKNAITAYGVWGKRHIYGKDVEGIIRSTFVIDVDENGDATVVDIQRNVRAKGHVARLGKSLGLELKLD